MTRGAGREEASGRGADDRRVRSRLIVALAAGLLALMGAVVVLFAFGRETQALQSELADVVEPANAVLLDVQRILALQMAAQRGYQLAGADEALEAYRELLTEEREAYRRLGLLIHPLGPDATAALTSLRAAAERWHEAVERSAADEPDGLSARLSTRQGYFANALSEAGRLGEIIGARADQRREALAERQRIELLLVIALLLLALFAFIMLARLGHRLHVLGSEARRVARLAESRHEALLRAGEEKEAFIRGVTHDLKNPLGVIDGSAELLEVGARGELTPDQRRTTARIRRAAAEMLGTINDLLELSRAEAAVLTVRETRISVNDLVLQAVESYRPALHAEGLELRCVPLPEDRPITTDPVRIKEILGNLLTNAAKHGAEGGRVLVEVALDRIDSAPAIAVSVVDNGPGVPPGREEEIFAEFARGDESDGSGLGLSIARRLARLLGGDLVLNEPPPGGGAAFTLQLPLDPSSEREQAAGALD